MSKPSCHYLKFVTSSYFLANRQFTSSRPTIQQRVHTLSLFPPRNNASVDMVLKDACPASPTDLCRWTESGGKHAMIVQGLFGDGLVVWQLARSKTQNIIYLVVWQDDCRERQKSRGVWQGHYDHDGHCHPSIFPSPQHHPLINDYVSPHDGRRPHHYPPIQPPSPCPYVTIYDQYKAVHENEWAMLANSLWKVNCDNNAYYQYGGNTEGYIVWWPWQCTKEKNNRTGRTGEEIETRSDLIEDSFQPPKNSLKKKEKKCNPSDVKHYEVYCT